jgi:hypothetical protein
MTRELFGAIFALIIAFWFYGVLAALIFENIRRKM